MKTRALQPELMDDPDIDPDAHAAALRGLSRLNVVSNAAGPITRSIRKVVLESRSGPPSKISILDVATGSGDLPVSLGRFLNARGIEAQLHACDISETALSATQDRSARAGLTVHTHCIDVLEDPIPEVDVVTCALFLHHLKEDDVVRALDRLARAARRLLVVSDLCRSSMGLLAARVVPRLLTRSHVVHVDAVRSVQGAFSLSELEAIVDRTALSGASIRRIFPARMLLQWQPTA